MARTPPWASVVDNPAHGVAPPAVPANFAQSAPAKPGRETLAPGGTATSSFSRWSAGPGVGEGVLEVHELVVQIADAARPPRPPRDVGRTLLDRLAWRSPASEGWVSRVGSG